MPYNNQPGLKVYPIFQSLFYALILAFFPFSSASSKSANDSLIHVVKRHSANPANREILDRETIDFLKKLAVNDTIPYDTSESKYKYYGKLNDWFQAYMLGAPSFMESERSDFKKSTFVNVYIDPIIDHKHWIFWTTNKVTRARYNNKVAPYILIEPVFTPSDDFGSYSLKVNLTGSNEVKSRLTGIAEKVNKETLSAATGDLPSDFREQLTVGMEKMFDQLITSLGTSFAPPVVIGYKPQLEGGYGEMEILLNGDQIRIFEGMNADLELISLDKDLNPLDDNRVKWQNANKNGSTASVSMAGITRKEVSLSYRGYTSIITIRKSGDLFDIKDFLKEQILAVLQPRKQKYQDTLKIEQDKLTALDVDLVQQLGLFEAGNLKLSSNNSSTTTLRPVFTEPRTLSDESTFKSSDKRVKGFELLREKKDLTQKVRKKLNVVAFVDLVVEKPEALETLADGIIRSGGQLLAQILFDKSTSGQEQRVRNMIIDYLNSNIERIAGASTVAITDVPISLPVIEVSNPASIKVDESRIYINPFVPISAEERTSLLQEMNTALEEFGEKVFVNVSYSQDISTGSYQERAEIGRPAGLPDDYKFVNINYLNIPGSVMNQNLIAGDMEQLEGLSQSIREYELKKGLINFFAGAEMLGGVSIRKAKCVDDDLNKVISVSNAFFDYAGNPKYIEATIKGVTYQGTPRAFYAEEEGDLYGRLFQFYINGIRYSTWRSSRGIIGYAPANLNNPSLQEVKDNLVVLKAASLSKAQLVKIKDNCDYNLTINKAVGETLKMTYCNCRDIEDNAIIKGTIGNSVAYNFSGDEEIDMEFLTHLYGTNSIYDRISNQTRHTLKAKLFITSERTDPQLMQQIAAYDAGTETLKIWIHKEKGGEYKLKSVIDGIEDLETFLRQHGTLVTFEDIMINAAGAADQLATILYEVADFASQSLEKIKIPEYVWNPKHKDYKPQYALFYRHITFFMEPQREALTIFIKQVMAISTESASTTWTVASEKKLADHNFWEQDKIDISSLEFAMICGLYNGLVDIVKGIPDLVALVAKIGTAKGRAEMMQMYNSLSDYNNLETGNTGIWGALKDGLGKQFDFVNTPQLAVHTTTTFVVQIAIAFVSGGSSLTATFGKQFGTVLSIFKYIDNLADFGVAFKLVGKLTGSTYKFALKGTQKTLFTIKEGFFYAKVVKNNATELLKINIEKVPVLKTALSLAGEGGDYMLKMADNTTYRIRAELGDITEAIYKTIGITEGLFKSLKGLGLSDFQIDELFKKLGKDQAEFQKLFQRLNADEIAKGADFKKFVDDLISGDELRLAFKELSLDGGKVKEIFEGWAKLKALGRNQMKTDPDILKAVGKIVKNTDIPVDRLDNIINKLATSGIQCKTCINAGKKELRFLNEVLDDLDLFAKEFNKTTGFDEFLKEMGESGRKATGGSWTLEALMRGRKKYFEKETITGFEVNHVPGRDFAADVRTKFDEFTNYYEFKNWGSSQLGRSESKFVDQLVGTMSIINNLERMKFLFNPKRWTPSASQLKTALQAKPSLLDDLMISGKLQQLMPDEIILSGSDFIDNIIKPKYFNKVFITQ